MVSTLSLESLNTGNPDELFPAIESAFGTPDSLGIIVIRMPPDHPYHAQRKHLLSLAPLLAALPDAEKKALEHPASKYSFGWSHGKELMEGVPDDAKGSFYAQVYERPDLTPEFTAKNPSYGFKNVWPSPDILNGQSLEQAFVECGKTITETGVLLAERLDQFLATKHENLSSLQEALKSPLNCHKGRLLYYFPVSRDSSRLDSWCGLHLDHSLLTGLTRAITNPAVLPEGDQSGLYIQLPDGSFTKVGIPEDCVAFQVGQAASLLSKGVLRATPHLVKGSDAGGVERSTFACFLQPDVDFVLTQEGKTFSQFSEEILADHY
ncbi:hypothetical protein HDU79_008030 [Rhizoclosmatium sp. JEL0117]|nr:hypothetical protein HDU79_008030 [Rhizoclosmatium sp. JEL0117]